MILTPGQIEEHWRWLASDAGGYDSDLEETAKAYADIVQRVAETKYSSRVWVCPYCRAVFDDIPPDTHKPGCIVIAARKLRGLE